ncbi:MAG: hypothetical protein SF052_08920 [Bacteroidia bacterium]|nr:hypothetical protein [Bacteroidia bacterium]
MKKLLLIFLPFFLSCGAQKPSTNAPKPLFSRIDFHAHYNFERDSLPALFQSWNMRAVLIQVALGDSLRDQKNWEEMVKHYQDFPDQFFLCSGFEGTGIDETNYAAKKIEMIQKHITDGARMVKVWKNFGMVTQDVSGKYIQIDDPRLQPIWDYLTENDIPVIAHIGEPLQAWRELEHRILYGTDLGTDEPQQNLSPENRQNELNYLKKILSVDWAYFSGKDSMIYDSPMISFPVATEGLNLPDSVLHKFYYENAAKILKIENGD